MYLSRFGVKNYKCLGDIDIPLTPIHVLIGENDAGKTSLLEAIYALYASMEVEHLANAFPNYWKGLDLVSNLSKKDKVDLAGVWSEENGTQDFPTPKQFSYGLSIIFPQTGRECQRYTEWTGRSSHSYNFRKSPINSTIVSQLRHGKNTSDEDYSDLILISDNVKSAHNYSLNPKDLATPAAFDEKRKYRLDFDGFGLATFFDDILSYEPERFIQLREKFCKYFPQFKGIHIETEYALARSICKSGLVASTETQGKEVFFDTHEGTKMHACQASDGAVLFLAYMALAYSPNPPGLLLIEEPENGIYPKRLGEIITLLKDLVERTEGVRFPQIIMTTHSPYLLSYFQPEEVTFLSRPKDDPSGPVRARPLRDAPHIEDRLAGGQFYLGELWYNLSEEELFGDMECE